MPRQERRRKIKPSHMYRITHKHINKPTRTNKCTQRERKGAPTRKKTQYKALTHVQNHDEQIVCDVCCVMSVQSHNEQIVCDVFYLMSEQEHDEQAHEGRLVD